METDGLHTPSYFCLAQLTAASLADFTTARAPETLGGHAFVVGWKRSSLCATAQPAVGRPDT
eukprot:5155043-Prymnesium_polylepis.1